MYEINYSKAAEKYLKKIKDKTLKSTIKAAIDKICIDPYIGTQKVGDLRGIFGYDIKHGGINYELAYRIYEDDDKLVVVVLVGTRENFYEELKRLMN